MTEKKKLYIIPNQHMDLVWRRCFDRDIAFDGQNFVSYADIEEIYIKDSIRLCEKYPFYHFTVECVAVLDKFLRRNPEYEEVIARYIKEKRLYVPFSGNNIVDSNLISGESIVRNYLQGYHYMKGRFGHIADGADRNDAFGNSAQMPQIFRKFGVKWVYHVSYTPCSAPYWRGLDGSTVYDLEPVSAGTIGGYPKYRPCPVCKGYKDKPCGACGGRRIDQKHMDTRSFRLVLREDLINENEIPCYVLAGGEEVAPLEEIALWALENRDRYDIEFTDFETYSGHHRARIALVDAPPAEAVMDSPECNCNNTGVYVTRIKVKQKARQLENSIFAAETLAVADYLGGGQYPQKELDAIWEKTLFVMFHDAITSTHVDAGYEEVCDAIGQAQAMTDAIIARKAKLSGACGEGTVTVFNPYGIALSGMCEAVLEKDCTLEGASILWAEPEGDGVRIRFYVRRIGPYGTKTYQVVKAKAGHTKEVLFQAEEAVVTGDAVLTNNSAETAISSRESGDILLENEFYRLSITNNGIRDVYDKTLGKTVARESQYMVGEWILENDVGSPWATLSPDMRRQPLGKYTKILSHEKTAHCETVTFQITPDIRCGYVETGLRILYSVTLAKGVDRVLFSADVKWDTYNHRLRVAFPTGLKGRHMYDIPYGMLERKPYENDIVLPDGSSDWASRAGDWPAINWAGIDGGDRSIALFNRGTPSYQINTDSQGAETIYLSVLRSPAVPTCLHAAADYTMTAYDGMRDAGHHHFTYALKSYAGGFGDNSVHADGVGYNARLIASGAAVEPGGLPRLQSDNAWISSMLLARDGKGVILRAAEYRGKAGHLRIDLPQTIRAVYETDLKEDKLRSLDIKDGILQSAIEPFEIKTFYLELENES